MLDWLIGGVADSPVYAPGLAILVGVVLTVTPVSWASVPAVVALVAPARAAAATGAPAAVSRGRATAVVFGFVLGMDGSVAMAGAALSGVALLLARSAMVLSVVAAVVLAAAGITLLRRREPTLCRRVESLPPSPLHAVSAGAVFAVTGCPGCGPIAVALGAAATAAGPIGSAAVIGGFVVGRAVSLLAAAVWASDQLRSADPARLRRLDRIVGVALLAAAAVYAYRVSSGAVSTELPGQPGGPLP